MYRYYNESGELTEELNDGYYIFYQCNYGMDWSDSGLGIQTLEDARVLAAESEQEGVKALILKVMVKSVI